MVKMKYEILIYVLSIALIISGAVVTILHMGNGYRLMFYGALTMSAFQSWHIDRLKKRIKELEQNQ
jgi:cytochrome b561